MSGSVTTSPLGEIYGMLWAEMPGRARRAILSGGLVLAVVVALSAGNGCGDLSLDFPGEPPRLDAGAEVGPPCVDPSCLPSCGAGLLACGGACVDPLTDPLHCSGCGVVCADGEVCTAGGCGCADGKQRCGTSCVRTISDPLHCGACGTHCDGVTPVCDQGVCRASCTAGASACAGACVDPRSDPEHCGDCSASCPEGVRCARGICSCEDGQTLCGKRCVDTATDRANCGACGRGCPAATICRDTACQ